MLNIRISGNSSTPKYLQLANEIIRHIKAGRLSINDKLPSIHEICNNHDIARDTVVTAYNELKSRGIIQPRHGKGFYVASTAVKTKLKVFMLFDAMNGYKEILYRSIVENLGPDYQVDIFFHYYNIKLFGQLIRDNAGKYGCYVIMPHFNEDVSELVKPLPCESMIIIDKDIETCGDASRAVFQNFEKDVTNAMKKAFPLLKKYNTLHFISGPKFQFIPEGLLRGFTSFCKGKRLKYTVSNDIASAAPDRGDLVFAVSDHDLVETIKLANEKGWKPGKDIGIVSYDETPLKEILAGGISVISTDFRQMGKHTSDMIKGEKNGKIENRSYFIHRSSL